MRRLCLAVLAILLTVPATASAVVGGKAATPGKYPYMVAFEYDPAGGRTEFSQVCGASLVGADKVLTAAHCVYDDRDGNMRDEVIPPSSVQFLIGTYDLRNRAGAETIGATRIEVYPEYDAAYDAISASTA